MLQWQTDPRNGRGVLHSGCKGKYSPDHRGSHFQTTFKLYDGKRGKIMEEKGRWKKEEIGEGHKLGRERKKK